jgi:hypothetical protein
MIFFPQLILNFYKLRKSTIRTDTYFKHCYSWSRSTGRFGRAQSYCRREGLCLSYSKARNNLQVTHSITYK